MRSSEQVAMCMGAALVLAITPGPNMIYLVSRAICQGRAAAILSLMGVVAGLLSHLLFASVGLSALFMAVPMGYEILKYAGALYLLWMAWQAVRPGHASPFETNELPPESSRKLLVMGFLTSLLNPKIAIFYLSVLPQFINPDAGQVLAQSLVLGVTQVAIGTSVNLAFILSASFITFWFAQNPRWLAVQKYVMGGVLGLLAFKLLSQQRQVA